MTIPPRSDTLRNTIHGTIANTPLTWLNTAQDLKLSADLLWAAAVSLYAPELENAHQMRAHQSSYCLLMGYAFENLAKGIHLASIPPSEIRFEQARAKWPKGGHGSKGLLRSNTEVSDIESRLLKKLEDFVLTYGRYAIPMQPQKFNLGHWLEGDLFPTNDEYDAVQPLFSRLEAIILKPYPKV